MLAAGLGLAACSDSGRKAPVEVAPATVTAAADPQLLPLPVLPDSLTEPQQRAGFLAVHFWDAMDWKDRSRSLDTAFIEQNFANYVTVLPVADTVARREAVAGLMHAAEADSAAYAFLGSVAGKYLGDPNSPMRSEELYVLFLHELLASSVTDGAMKQRYGHQLQAAMKNRPGTLAADLRLTDSYGRSFTLRAAAAEADRTLVLFYDPDCDHCKATIAELSRMAMPADVQVLAVDVMADRERFDATKDAFPTGWRVALASEPVDDGDAYELPALPSLYLLDRSARVMLKDAPLEAVEAEFDVTP